MNDVVQQKANTPSGVLLTPAAKEHILTYLSRQKNTNGVRLAVKKTGCSGWSYAIDYVQAPEANDIIQTLNDSYSIYIDKASYPYLKGISIDYVRQGLNQKLVFNNPNQTGQCGCGESFTVD